MTTDPSSPALTPGDHIERLRAMAFDHGETWDLSDNDQAAIRWALFKLTEPEKQEEEKL